MTYDFDPQIIEKDVALSIRYVLIPAIGVWIVAGILFRLGWYVTSVVVLGIGLSAVAFLMATRFQEQVMRLVITNHELLLLSRERMSSPK